MPRGRKGHPQDSVDSILLAISRRDTIDTDTLSHYFDRLDEEWTAGARTKVLHLLHTHDAAAHAAAALILSELATDFDLGELEDVVADPRVGDLAKLTLAPVLKELNSEMADDGLIEYLNDPDGAMQQMQMRLLNLMGQSELGVESVLEDVLSMPLEKRLSFVDWLGHSQDSRAAHLLIPLLENASGKIIGAAVDALEQLGSCAAHQSIPALNYLIAHTSNRQVKQHARAALGRLTMHSALGMEDVAMADAQQYHLPLHEVFVSFIDGSGSQMMLFSWLRGDGLLKGVNILYQDQWGIKDCYGTDEMQVQHWTELVSEMAERGFGSFKVPLEYAQSLVAEARAVNKRTRRKLPIAYSIWRPFIEGDKPSRDLSTMLEPIALSPEVVQLAQLGGELYQLPEFSSWLFEPLGRLRPYIDRFWSSRTFDIPKAGQRGRMRKTDEQEQAMKANVEAILKDAMDELVDSNWRALYETRLRRQAALFQFAGRTHDVTLVRAVAAVLHPSSTVPLVEQVFLRAMFLLTLEQGPLRVMIEALESGKFGPLPIGLFPGEK